MPANNDAVTAARFSISIDGYEVGRFATLALVAHPGQAPRPVQPQELAQLARTSAPAAKRPTLHLKRGQVSATAMARLRQPRPGTDLVLAGLDATGRATGRATARKAYVLTTVQHAAKGGSEVAMEELVLAHEGFG